MDRADEACGGGHRCSDDDAGESRGAGFGAGLSVHDADLVNGRSRGQRGGQLRGQHHRPLQQLGGRHHGRGRRRSNRDVCGRDQFRPDLMMTNSQSESSSGGTRHG